MPNVSVMRVAAQGRTTQTPADKERREAERVWEQMVEIKGGQERLRSTITMLLISGDKPKNMGVQFYVYPSKSWSWWQAPPSPDTVWVDMTNLERDISIVVSNGGTYNPLEVTEERRRDIRREMLERACAYLLETKWLRPVPLRVTRQRVGGKLMDVVETRLRDAESGLDERMDFVVEPESLLVYRVVRYYKGKPLSFYCFDDYAAADGIQMPRRMGDIDYPLWNKECRYPYALKTQFNVEYDEKLFERPPSVEAGAEAWKPKR